MTSPVELAIPAVGPDAVRPPPSPVVTADARAPEQGGWMTVPGKGVAPAFTERSAVLEAIHTSKHRAILRHEAHVEDCSSIGGSHLYFVVLGPGNEVAYYGGRGAHLPGFEVGVHFLAAIEPLPTPRSTKDAYACVPDRKVHARVIALLPIESAAEGTRLLEELGPPP